MLKQYEFTGPTITAKFYDYYIKRIKAEIISAKQQITRLERKTITPLLNHLPEIYCSEKLVKLRDVITTLAPYEVIEDLGKYTIQYLAFQQQLKNLKKRKTAYLKRNNCLVIETVYCFGFYSKHDIKMQKTCILCLDNFSPTFKGAFVSNCCLQYNYCRECVQKCIIQKLPLLYCSCEKPTGYFID